MARIFLAGATGVIGIRLLPLLIAEGHTVAAMTRSESKREQLTEAGAEPVVCDVYDAEALRDAVVAFAPDALLHQLTDLPDSAEDIPQLAARNARIRTRGTRRQPDDRGDGSRPRHFLAQSIAWTPAGGAETLRKTRRKPGARGQRRRGEVRTALRPGTYYETTLPEHPRIHVDAAANRTVPLVTAPSGTIVLADDAD